MNNNMSKQIEEWEKEQGVVKPKLNKDGSVRQKPVFRSYTKHELKSFRAMITQFGAKEVADIAKLSYACVNKMQNGRSKTGTHRTLEKFYNALSICKEKSKSLEQSKPIVLERIKEKAPKRKIPETSKPKVLTARQQAHHDEQDAIAEAANAEIYKEMNNEYMSATEALAIIEPIMLKLRNKDQARVLNWFGTEFTDSNWQLKGKQ